MTQELISALSKAHLKIKAPKKDGINAHFKNKYCTLDSIYEACRVPLAENGLSIIHTVETSAAGSYFLSTTLYHSSGQCISNSIPIFLERATPQAFGSALTYARRYAITSLLTLPSDEDDDGNQAEENFKNTNRSQVVASQALTSSEVKKNYISIENADQLEKEIIERAHPIDKNYLKKILNHHGVKSLRQIEAQFEPTIRFWLQKAVDEFKKQQIESA